MNEQVIEGVLFTHPKGGGKIQRTRQEEGSGNKNVKHGHQDKTRRQTEMQLIM